MSNNIKKTVDDLLNKEGQSVVCSYCIHGNECPGGVMNYGNGPVFPGSYFKKRCEKCEYVKTISAGFAGYKFNGCLKEPYRGKPVWEIDICPLDKEFVDFDKFLVIKREYIDGEEAWFHEKKLIDIAMGRRMVMTGRKDSPKYLVINIEEPYADEVIAILKRNGHWG